MLCQLCHSFHPKERLWCQFLCSACIAGLSLDTLFHSEKTKSIEIDSIEADSLSWGADSWHRWSWQRVARSQQSLAAITGAIEGQPKVSPGVVVKRCTHTAVGHLHVAQSPWDCWPGLYEGRHELVLVWKEPENWSKQAAIDGGAGIGVHGLFRARVYGLTLNPYENWARRV